MLLNIDEGRPDITDRAKDAFCIVRNGRSLGRESLPMNHLSAAGPRILDPSGEKYVAEPGPTSIAFFRWTSFRPRQELPRHKGSYGAFRPSDVASLPAL